MFGLQKAPLDSIHARTQAMHAFYIFIILPILKSEFRVKRPLDLAGHIPIISFLGRNPVPRGGGDPSESLVIQVPPSLLSAKLN